MNAAAQMRETISPWLDTAAAAVYLGSSPGTMKNWRHRGEGPTFHIVNKKLVRYHRDELDAYVRGETAR